MSNSANPIQARLTTAARQWATLTLPLLTTFSIFVLGVCPRRTVAATSTNSAAAQPELKTCPSSVKIKSEPDGRRPLPRNSPGLRGVFFNPQVNRGKSPEFPWLLLYPQCRNEIRVHLQELVRTTDLNFVCIFVNIAHSLRQPSQSPPEGQPLIAWANTAYWDNVAAFIDDCASAGVSVEIDLASNLWVPRSAEPLHQIANSGNWPMPGEAPCRFTLLPDYSGGK
jgi:hypothetical protein